MNWSIDWAEPLYLLLIPVVFVIAGISLWIKNTIRKQQASLGWAQAYEKRLWFPSSSLIRHILLCLALSLIAVCLAQPRWGEYSQIQKQKGANIIFALDCSRSMLANDFYPTRLDTAKRKAADIMNDSAQHRVALLPFAGISILRTPLTGDHNAVEIMLDDCDPDLFPAKYGMQGTSIGKAVSEAIDLLPNDERGQAVIIFSDGVDPDNESIEAAKEKAIKTGIPIYGIFLGDPEQSPTLMIDGKEEIMTADRSSLDDLATASGGLSIWASIDKSDTDAIIEHIENNVHLAPWQEERRQVSAERYWFFLIAALACFGLGFLFQDGRYKTKQKVTQFSRTTSLILFCMLSFTNIQAEDAFLELDNFQSFSKADQAAAIVRLEEALEAEPERHDIHYNLGFALLAQGKQEDQQRAADHFRKASQSSVRGLRARAQHNLAHAEFTLGRYQAALAAAESALALDAEDAAFKQTRNAVRAAYFRAQEAARLAAEEAAKRLRIGTKQLPDAFVGELYQAQVEALGGAGAPYKFAPESGKELPAGLSIGIDGSIKGTPTQDGEQNIALTVSDNNNESSNGTIRLKIWPKPTLEPETLPPAIINQPFTARLRSEGIPNPAWTIQGLPDGLEYSNRGNILTISGISPAEAANLTLQIDVYQDNATTDKKRGLTKHIPLIISDSFAPDMSEVPPATQFAPYKYLIPLRGPDAYYTWEGKNDDFSFDQFGTLSGTAQTAGKSEIPLRINDAQRSEEFMLSMTVNPPPIINDPGSLNGIQGQRLQQALPLEGGTAPFIWTIRDGFLPNGVELNQQGELSGIPQEIGSFTCTVQVNDRWAAQTQREITLTINENQEHPDQSQQQESEQEQQAQNGENGQEGEQGQQDQESEGGKNGEQSNDNSEQAQNSEQNQGEQNNQKDSQQDAQANAGDKDDERLDGSQGEQNKENNDENGESNSALSQGKNGNDLDQAEQQAEGIRSRGARHWLERLPEESKDALRYQLLLDQDQNHSESENKQTW